MLTPQKGIAQGQYNCECKNKIQCVYDNNFVIGRYKCKNNSQGHSDKRCKVCDTGPSEFKHTDYTYAQRCEPRDGYSGCSNPCSSSDCKNGRNPSKCNTVTYKFSKCNGSYPYCGDCIYEEKYWWVPINL